MAGILQSLGRSIRVQRLRGGWRLVCVCAAVVSGRQRCFVSMECWWGYDSRGKATAGAFLGTKVHAKLWNDTLHSSPRLRVPLTLETVKKDGWILARKWAVEDLDGLWSERVPGMVWMYYCDLVPDFFRDRSVVMYSVAVVESGKIWSTIAPTPPSTRTQKPVKHSTYFLLRLVLNPDFQILGAEAISLPPLFLHLAVFVKKQF